MQLLENKDNLWASVSDDNLALIEEVINFLRSEFPYNIGGELWTKEYFQWKLGSSNPAGKGFISVALVKGRVVGVVTLTRKRILLNGVMCDGGEVGDSYSTSRGRRNASPLKLSAHDPNPKSYLNKSIFGRLAFDVRTRAENCGISIIYGVPNKNAYPSWINRLDYFEARKANLFSFSRPGNYYLVNKFTKLKKISFLFKLINKININICSLLYNFKYKDINLICNEFKKNEVDKLWEKIKPINGFSLMRDAAYWKYRYLQRPAVEYKIFNYYLSDALVGIVAVRVIEDKKFKSTICIAEWMSSRDISDDYLIFKVVEYFKDDDINFFNLWAGTDIGKKFTKLFFNKRKKIPIIYSNNKSNDFLKNSEEIVFYMGNSDAI